MVTWQEGRAEFAKNNLELPFRQWYEQASHNDVERWHAEHNKKWKIIRTLQKLITLAFGVNCFSTELVEMLTFVLESVQQKRDNRRVAAMQKLL